MKRILSAVVLVALVAAHPRAGAGIDPDIQVPEAEALRKAHSLGLEMQTKAVKSGKN